MYIGVFDYFLTEFEMIEWNMQSSVFFSWLKIMQLFSFLLLNIVVVFLILMPLCSILIKSFRHFSDCRKFSCYQVFAYSFCFLFLNTLLIHNFSNLSNIYFLFLPIGKLKNATSRLVLAWKLFRKKLSHIFKCNLFVVRRPLVCFLADPK